MASSSHASKHVWTKEEKAILVECLVEFVSTGGWKSDNDTFRPAEGLLNKLCPYYDELAYVFRRDRATGRGAETFADVKSNDPSGYEGFQLHDRNDIEIPTMYNQGFNMSRRIYGPHDLVEHPMVGLDQSDQSKKGGGQRVEHVDLIHKAMKCANDQLRVIVEWTSVALQNETTVHQEVLCQLHAIPELSRLDRVHYSRILFCNLDDMRGFLEILEDEKMDFCTVLLREDS
ncbi:retrotransposon protein [Cucumis melo var. makuwa]|uniref:Retrotransposon protein n=1 Tax=Cucumis melo var. makuwa TaxID=1194695 RepID=A0A5A7URM1_CUCMM|nr:retrotransposon protein [Cucumis melo var. makuwa]